MSFGTFQLSASIRSTWPARRNASSRRTWERTKDSADDRVYYTHAKGKRTYGESKALKAHWHLGMRAVVRLGEAPTVRLRPYVVFTRVIMRLRFSRTRKVAP
jgi:hypothetical protein